MSVLQLTPAEALERAATHRLVLHVVDGRQVATLAQLYAAISSALSFPAYFGANLDALEECLRDLSWLGPATARALVLTGECPMIATTDFARVAEVFDEAVARGAPAVQLWHVRARTA